MVDITTEQDVPFTFKVTDGKGRTVAVDTSGGGPTGSTSDATVATVDPLVANPDNTFSGLVKSVTPGDAHIVVRADADLGEGIQEVLGEGDVHVTLDPATGQRIAQLTFGTPVDRP